MCMLARCAGHGDDPIASFNLCIGKVKPPIISEDVDVSTFLCMITTTSYRVIGVIVSLLRGVHICPSDLVLNNYRLVHE